MVDMTPKFETLCRLCLTENVEPIDIFSNKEMTAHEISISNKLINCFGLEVLKDDLLPKVICPQCNYHLEQCYYFKKRCLSSDCLLKKHMQIICMGKKSDILVKNTMSNSNQRTSVDNDVVKNAIKSIEAYKINSNLDYKKDLLNAIIEELRPLLDTQIREKLREELHAEIEENCSKTERIKLLDELTTFLNREKDSVIQVKNVKSLESNKIQLENTTNENPSALEINLDEDHNPSSQTNQNNDLFSIASVNRLFIKTENLKDTDSVNANNESIEDFVTKEGFLKDITDPENLLNTQYPLTSDDPTIFSNDPLVQSFSNEYLDIRNDLLIHNTENHLLNSDNDQKKVESNERSRSHSLNSSSKLQNKNKNGITKIRLRTYKCTLCQKLITGNKSHIRRHVHTMKHQESMKKYLLSEQFLT